MDFVTTIVNEVVKAIEKKNAKLYYDKTFASVVYEINGDGTYTIIKDKQKYKVKCAIGTTLSLGTHVWVKIPCGNKRLTYLGSVPAISRSVSAALCTTVPM